MKKNKKPTTNFVDDIIDMHWKFKAIDWACKKNKEKDYASLLKFLHFRMECIKEELNETNGAIDRKDAEEVVDGLIDIMVFSLGTLNLFGVDESKAWEEVLRANMSKEVGIKKTRPNPLGLPDLIKPKNWKSPSHRGNTGILEEVLNHDM